MAEQIGVKRGSQDLATGESMSFPVRSGLVILSDYTLSVAFGTGYFVPNKSDILIDYGHLSKTKNNSGTVNVYHEGSNLYIQNNYSKSLNIGYVLIGISWFIDLV